MIEPAYRSIRNASQIVIIGYSFGMNPDGMTDQVSLNALVEYCGNARVRIVIVELFSSLFPFQMPDGSVR